MKARRPATKDKKPTGGSVAEKTANFCGVCRHGENDAHRARDSCSKFPKPHRKGKGNTKSKVSEVSESGNVIEDASASLAFWLDTNKRD